MKPTLTLLAALSLGALAQAQLTADLNSVTELQVVGDGSVSSLPAQTRLFAGFQLQAVGGSGSSTLSIDLSQSDTEYVYDQVERMVGRGGSESSFGLSGGFAPHSTRLFLQAPQTLAGRLEISWSEAGFYPAEWDLGANVDVDADGTSEFFVDSVTGQTGVSGSISLPLSVGPAGRAVRLDTWGWMEADPLPGLSGIIGTTKIRFVPEGCQVVTVGSGCGPTLEVATTFSNTIRFDVSGVPTAPGSFAYLLGGTPRTPLLLPGSCTLYLNPVYRVPMVSTGPGTARLEFPLGFPGSFNVQAAVLDGQTGALELTDALQITCP